MPAGHRPCSHGERTLIVNSITDSAIVAALGRQLNRTVARQQVAASNLANIDTPGYRAQDAVCRNAGCVAETDVGRRGRAHHHRNVRRGDSPRR